jgi:hypothetical protein
MSEHEYPDPTEQRFYPGDVLTIRGNEYEVESVDVLPDGDVLQYRLESYEEGLAGTLRIQDGGYVIAEYRDVEPEDITVIA